MMNYETADISYVSDKLVITPLPRTMWPIFASFVKFCCYFTAVTPVYCKIPSKCYIC